MQDIRGLDVFTDLGVIESKNRIRFCQSGQNQTPQSISFEVFLQNIEKPHQQFQKLTPLHV